MLVQTQQKNYTLDEYRQLGETAEFTTNPIDRGHSSG